MSVGGPRLSQIAQGLEPLLSRWAPRWPAAGPTGTDLALVPLGAAHSKPPINRLRGEPVLNIKKPDGADPSRLYFQIGSSR
jgi:hypothetical protein